MPGVEVVVELREGTVFEGRDENGLVIAMDGTAAIGGQGRGPTPMRVLAMALGGCTGMDVISILRKMRQDVTGYAVHVSGARAEAHPQVYTELHVEHNVRGNDLKPEAVRRAVELSATRYCPISAMLGRAVPLTHTYRVLNADGAELARGDIDAAAIS